MSGPCDLAGEKINPYVKGESKREGDQTDGFLETIAFQGGWNNLAANSLNDG